MMADDKEKLIQKVVAEVLKAMGSVSDAGRLCRCGRI